MNSYNVTSVVSNAVESQINQLRISREDTVSTLCGLKRPFDISVVL